MKCWAFDPGYHPFTDCVMQYFWLESEITVDDENPPVRAVCVVLNPPDVVACEENSWCAVTYPNAGTVYPAAWDGLASGAWVKILEKVDGVQWTVEDVLDELGYELQEGEAPDFPVPPDTTPIWGWDVETEADLPSDPKPSTYYWVKDTQRVHGFVYERVEMGSPCSWQNAEWTQDLTDFFGRDPRVVPEPS